MSGALPVVVPAGALLPGLHGLRAAAALMVLVYHVHGAPNLPIPESMPWINTRLGLGVHLFFVLSAFSLAWSNPGAAERPGPYLVKRLFRIAPLWLALQGLVLVVYGPPSFAVAVADLTFTFNLVPGLHFSRVWAGWTVGAEMVFYVVLPLLLLVRSLWGTVALAVIAVLVGLAAREALGSGPMAAVDRYADVAFVSNLPVFVAGLLAFRVFERVRGTAQTGLAAGLAAGVALGLAATLLSPLGLWLGLAGAVDLLGFGFAFAALCLWQALRPSWLLRNGVAVWLGERSYSLYLLHTPVIIVLYRRVYPAIYDVMGEPWGFFGCVLATLPPLCLAAEVSYRCVERPGIAIGRRVVRWMGEARTGSGRGRAGAGAEPAQSARAA